MDPVALPAARPREGSGISGLLLAALLAFPPGAMAQEEACGLPRAVLEEQIGMAAEIQTDTISDWRTQEAKDGCRLTAAGGAPDMQWVITTLSDALESGGWSPFSEAFTSAHGSTFAYGQTGVECSFGVYPAGVLGTAAERALLERVERVPGQKRYTVTANCIPQGP